MIKRLLIIPARSGSKRIRNKNIKNFSGKPIIYHSIKTAQKSKLFDTIHVSTDSLKFLNIIKKLNVDGSFLRPKNLSSDKVPLTRVIKYVLEKFKKNNEIFDQVWIFMPCAPLILKENLIKASKILNSKKNFAFTTVVENAHYPQWSFIIKKNFLQPIDKSSLLKRSQELKKTFFDLGLVAGWKTNYFLTNLKKNKQFKFYPLILNKFQSVDIDNINEWNFAKIIYKHKYHLN